jgi:hypothetical protein
MVMGIERLSVAEQRIILQCMKATAAYVDDGEKHSRLGIEANELKEMIAQWPNINDGDENGVGFLAINNSMNEVRNGFRIAPGEWKTWFDSTIGEVESTYRKWLAVNRTSGGIR